MPLATRHEFDYLIGVGTTEYELFVKYTYYPAYKGAYEGGQQIEPDEPSSIDIDSCTVKLETGVVEFPLSNALIEEIEEAIRCE